MSERWLFHVVLVADVPPWLVDGSTPSGQRYRASSLEREGFIHASYRDAVRESARLYFPEGAELRVLVIDPRRLDVPVVVADTPRGPMPHVRGSIPAEALRVVRLEDVDGHPDRVSR